MGKYDKEDNENISEAKSTLLNRMTEHVENSIIKSLDEKLKIKPLERNVLDAIFYSSPYSISEIEQCYFNFNKSIDDTLRHLEYASRFDLSPTDPIPFTKEWIIRLGGVQGANKSNFFIKCLDITISLNISVPNGTVHCYKKCEWIGGVDYVHQFQHLYSLLNKKELSIIKS